MFAAGLRLSTVQLRAGPEESCSRKHRRPIGDLSPLRPALKQPLSLPDSFDSALGARSMCRGRLKTPANHVNTCEYSPRIPKLVARIGALEGLVCTVSVSTCIPT